VKDWQLVERRSGGPIKENCLRPRLSRPTAARATCRYLALRLSRKCGGAAEAWGTGLAFPSAHSCG
jgi:hypothetical protein